MRKITIAPSVLSLDYAHFNEQCKALEKSEAQWCHFDVMDGHFVPNLTFGPDILKGFRKACPTLFMDVHLMIEDPEMFIPRFHAAGADLISFHVEAVKDKAKIHELIHKIHELGLQAGLVIKPKTDAHVLDEFLEEIDLVLIMSVEPGFGGQSFMEDQLDKVRYLRRIIDEKQIPCVIEIDGGINDVTAKKAIEAGVDVLVAGSYVFKGDIEENVRKLLP